MNEQTNHLERLFHKWRLDTELPPACVLSHCSVSDSLQPHGLSPARLLCPWDPPSKDTAVGCHALLSCLEDPQIKHSGPQNWKRA